MGRRSRIKTWKRWLRWKKEALESYVVDLIYDRAPHSRTAFLLGGFLRALSWIFAGLVKIRYWLYQERILRNHHLGCLVIVVGNLTVGGTGKTPVVEKLARGLKERGRKVAILSRGYKSKAEPLWRRWWRWLTHREPELPKIVSDGANVLLPVEEAGDEPYMLARNLPGVIVLVDKDRVKAGLFAIKRFQADTLILDDGFQYFALKDHLQLLMIDKTNPFGNRCLLPRGILREPVSHLKRASYVFLTKSDGQPDRELERTIRKYKPEGEFIECTHRPQFLQLLENGRREELAALQDRKVAAFCGIATPESFAGFLRNFGAVIVTHQWFLDHHFYRPDELAALAARAIREGAEWMITTEKDAVRIDARRSLPLPVYYLRVEIEIIRGVKDFEEAVSRICFPNERKRLTPLPIAR